MKNCPKCGNWVYYEGKVERCLCGHWYDLDHPRRNPTLEDQKEHKKDMGALGSYRVDRTDHGNRQQYEREYERYLGGYNG